MRFVWGITGAGDYLSESLSVIRRISGELGAEVTVAVSKNGEVVLKWYRLWEKLNSSFRKVMVEKGPNSPFLAGPLQVGYYSLLVISPATANTIAKIAYGIADTLLTNCVAQAVKGGTPVYIYPIDQKHGTLTTTTPDDRLITITTRRVDVENVDRIRSMQGISVLGHPAEIESVVASMTAGNLSNRGA